MLVLPTATTVAYESFDVTATVPLLYFLRPRFLLHLSLRVANKWHADGGANIQGHRGGVRMGAKKHPARGGRRQWEGQGESTQWPMSHAREGRRGRGREGGKLEEQEGGDC